MVHLSDVVVVAIITQVGTLLVAVVSAVNALSAKKKAIEASAHSQKAAHEVTNSHSTNIRTDLDEKFACVDQQIGGICDRITGIESTTDKALALSAQSISISENVTQVMTGIQSDIRGIRRDIGRSADQRDRIESRIHDLEIGRVP